MNILDILIYLVGTFVVAYSVYGIYKTVRARVVAGKAGIVKVCVNWITLIAQLAVCAFFAYFGINRMSAARDYLRKADAAEALVNGVEGIVGSDYQQVSEKSISEKADNLRKQIAKYRELGEAYKTYAIVMLICAASELVSGAAAVWYITEEGIMLTNLKMPEPFYTVLNGNKIEVHFMAQFKNGNKVITFKSTPKNLAIFGRFMQWEEEQNPQFPQNVPFPQSPQYQITQNPNDKEQL